MGQSGVGRKANPASQKTLWNPDQFGRGARTRNFRGRIPNVQGRTEASSPSSSTGTDAELWTLMDFVWKYSTSWRSAWLPKATAWK